jgi:hypothetical protein
MTSDFRLVCHADNINAAVQILRVAMQPAEDGSLHLHYVLHGDLSKLRIPEPQVPEYADGLWRHTCFEAFVALEGEAGYREFNFSPSGRWAAYAFEAYRVPATAFEASAPRISVVQTRQELRLQVSLATTGLPLRGSGTMLLGLTAVLEADDGSLSYWALHHPCAHPDFHHRAGFTGKLRR